MRLLRRRRREPQTESHLVVRLLGADEEQTLARYDLPAVIEADDDGQYPLIQALIETFDRPLEIHGIEVTMRHGPPTAINMRRLVDSLPQSLDE